MCERYRDRIDKQMQGRRQKMPVKMEEIRMKKGIYLCLCIALLFTAVSISAADYDFSDCSLEELIKLRNDVDMAIYEKDGFVIADAGTYVAGKDIAEGSYIITAFPESEENSGVLNYTVYKYAGAKEEYEKADNAYDTAFMNAEAAETAGEKPTWPERVNESDYFVSSGRLKSDSCESAKVELSEGEAIEFSTSWGAVNIAIKKADGLFFD